MDAIELEDGTLVLLRLKTHEVPASSRLKKLKEKLPNSPRKKKRAISQQSKLLIYWRTSTKAMISGCTEGC